MNLPAHKKMLSAAAAASVLLLTAACGSSDSDGAAADAATSAPAADSTDATEPAAGDAAADGTYADGDYSAEGAYQNPGGQSTVAVDLTIADGVVSDVTVTPEATNGTSLQFQKKFAGGISDEVVGKSLDELNVSKVAGSSLTSGGFNEAIEQIKADAQA